MAKAFITLLSNKSYLPGVIALKRALDHVKSKYPLYCMLSKGIDPSIYTILEKHNIKNIQLSHSAAITNINQNTSNSHWDATFDKLLAWDFTQFEKLVFIDADMLIVRNIDELFNYPGFSATVAGSQMSGNENWNNLNSGLIVIEPNKEIANKLISLIPNAIDQAKQNKKCIGDQNILYTYFPDWPKHKELKLNEKYNIIYAYIEYYVNKLEYSLNKKSKKQICIVHFTGKMKPWMPLTFGQRIRLVKQLLKNNNQAKAYMLYRHYWRNI